DASKHEVPSSTTIGVGNQGGVRAGAVSTSSRPHPGFEGRAIGRHALATPKSTEEAGLFGLRLLARHQARDGSWSSANLKNLCVGASSCAPSDAKYSAHFDEGLTALGALAFLGAGYGHDARALLVDPVKARRFAIGADIVLPALRWLSDRQKPD